MADDHPQDKSPLTRRIALLCRAGEVSSLDIQLASEARRWVKGEVILITAPDADGAIVRVFRRGANWVVGRLRGRTSASQGDVQLPPGMRVVAIAEKNLPTVLAEEQVDLLVDLRGRGDAAILGAALPCGALGIECDGRPETLALATMFGPGSWRIEVILTAPGSGGRGRLAQYVHHSAGPVLWQDRRQAAGRVVALILRSLRRVELSAETTAGLPRGPLPAWRYVTGAGRAAARRISERAQRGRRRTDQWFLASRPKPQTTIGERFSAEGFRLHRPEGNRFWADPCVIRWDGTNYVFFEEFDSSEGRGVISCSTIAPDGGFSEPRRVLIQPYHLSYPFVFEHEKTVYMVPESSENGTVDLYKAVEFPWEWELVGTLLTNINAVDSTLYHDGKLWWLFASVSEYGSSSWDELFLFYADSLQGPWLPHQANPVKSDPSSARPAGGLWAENGSLMRPAQDCSTGYGQGLSICRVTTLTPEAFSEEVIRRIPAEQFLQCSALHTISASIDLEVIDARV